MSESNENNLARIAFPSKLILNDPKSMMNDVDFAFLKNRYLDIPTDTLAVVIFSGKNYTRVLTFLGEGWIRTPELKFFGNVSYNNVVDVTSPLYGSFSGSMF